MIKYYQIELQNAAAVNAALWRQFQEMRDNPELKRSHFFAGRYENIYIDRQLIPAVQPVLDAAVQAAADYLGCSVKGLSAGFWFNEMGPGHVTLTHTHDDDDELLSGVYYVRVPPDSGYLELGGGGVKQVITPVEGGFVFFDPKLPHAVSDNLGNEVRLSIGMNFGRDPG